MTTIWQLFPSNSDDGFYEYLFTEEKDASNLQEFIELGGRTFYKSKPMALYLIEETTVRESTKDAIEDFLNDYTNYNFIPAWLERHGNLRAEYPEFCIEVVNKGPYFYAVPRLGKLHKDGYMVLRQGTLESSLDLFEVLTYKEPYTLIDPLNILTPRLERAKQMLEEHGVDLP